MENFPEKSTVPLPPVPEDETLRENRRINSEAFLPEGPAGRFGRPYDALHTPSRKIFAAFSAYTKLFHPGEGAFSADSFHPYSRFVTRRVYFRPTDEIWTFDGVIPRPEKIKRHLNNYAPSLCAVFQNAPSFALDIDLAGGTIETIAKRGYFVIPRGKMTKKLFSAAANLRMCGVVTSDGIIRFLSGEEETAAFDPLPVRARHRASPLFIETEKDFDAGLLAGVSEMLAVAPGDDFPFAAEQPGPNPENLPAFRLGYATVVELSRRVFPQGAPARKKPKKQPSVPAKKDIKAADALYVSRLNLPRGDRGLDWAGFYKTLFAVADLARRERAGGSFFAAGLFTKPPEKDMFAGYAISGEDLFRDEGAGFVIITERAPGNFPAARLEKLP